MIFQPMYCEHYPHHLITLCTTQLTLTYRPQHNTVACVETFQEYTYKYSMSHYLLFNLNFILVCALILFFKQVINLTHMIWELLYSFSLSTI